MIFNYIMNTVEACVCGPSEHRKGHGCCDPENDIIAVESMNRRSHFKKFYSQSPFFSSLRIFFSVFRIMCKDVPIKGMMFISGRRFELTGRCLESELEFS